MKFIVFFFNDTATTEIYTLSLHDALPICLTETSPAACINPPDEPFNGSIGLPISSTEISIKDDAGNDLALGQPGEICVRGPQVMRGYWNRADETATGMLPGGWLRTRDVGRIYARGFGYPEGRD